MRPPHERTTFLGSPNLEARTRSLIDTNALTHGWLLTGPRGVGKATFAYRLARFLLAPDARQSSGLAVDFDDKAVKLVTARAHPDLFIAERRFDEKKNRLETEIPVDTIRSLSTFFSRKPAMGGFRVAIIDAADEMNRNAANALLKALEEPPARTVLLLISHAPGRLIATIRSRCRRLEVRPLEDAEVEAFLRAEGHGADAEAIASAAGGRPGRALELAEGEGAEALNAVSGFFNCVSRGGDLDPVVRKLTAKGAEARWASFSQLLLENLSSKARSVAVSVDREEAAAAPQYLRAYEEVSELVSAGDGLNLDRAQTIHAMRRRVQAALN